MKNSNLFNLLVFDVRCSMEHGTRNTEIKHEHRNTFSPHHFIIQCAYWMQFCFPQMNIEEIEVRVRERDRRKEESCYFPLIENETTTAKTKYFLCCHTPSRRTTPEEYFLNSLQAILYIIKNPMFFPKCYRNGNQKLAWFGCFASSGPAKG